MPKQKVVSEALRYCVMRAVSTMTPKRFDEIWWDVVNDYGRVTVRQVYRALAVLRETGSIRRVRSDSTQWGYLRRRRRRRFNARTTRKAVA
jgi:Fe2+ or Zn2+ uptake regulation protein